MVIISRILGEVDVRYTSCVSELKSGNGEVVSNAKSKLCEQSRRWEHATHLAYHKVETLYTHKPYSAPEKRSLIHAWRSAVKIPRNGKAFGVDYKAVSGIFQSYIARVDDRGNRKESRRGSPLVVVVVLVAEQDQTGPFTHSSRMFGSSRLGAIVSFTHQYPNLSLRSSQHYNRLSLSAFLKIHM